MGPEFLIQDSPNLATGQTAGSVLGLGSGLYPLAKSRLSIGFELRRLT
jgi:hypothetical protein